MLKAGAVSRCKPGAADDEKADQPTGKESGNAPAPGASGANAPGATSPCRSVGAPAPGADAPGFILFSIKTATFNPPSASDAFNKIVRQAADCIAKSIDNMVESLEHLVFESHGAKLLPDLLYGIHFRCVWRDMQQGDVFRDDQSL